ncbi:MAG TPA: xanthine dehydrogenase family protein subunit M [Beijerinckiaceae bacterium]
MYAFDYHRASSVDEARRLLGERDEGKLLAGGMTLIPTLKLRLAAPSQLIDLGGIADLKGIALSDDAVTIGAMTTHAAVAASEAVRAAIPALATLAGGIGDVQVRHRGTIGGSIANNDPAADYPAGCLGLGATIVTDRREIAADDFFRGLFQTALDQDEIIVAVRFPRPQRAAYVKFPNPASRYAIVGVLVSRGPQGVRVAVTGAGENGVFRATELERALETDFSEAALDRVSLPGEGLFDDVHGTAAYRAHLIGILARRGVAACR